MSNAAFRVLGWGLELAGLLLLVTGCVLAWAHWRRTRGWRTALGTVVDQAVRAPTPGNPYAFPMVEHRRPWSHRLHRRSDVRHARPLRPFCTGPRSWRDYSRRCRPRAGTASCNWPRPSTRRGTSGHFITGSVPLPRGKRRCLSNASVARLAQWQTRTGSADRMRIPASPAPANRQRSSWPFPGKARTPLRGRRSACPEVPARSPCFPGRAGHRDGPMPSRPVPRWSPEVATRRESSPAHAVATR